IEGKVDFDEAQRLVQQHSARQYGCAGKVAVERRVVRRDFECVPEVHRKIFSASDCSACWGSLPVALRGSRSTISSGRGRNTASIRWRRDSMIVAALRPGATTAAARRAMPVTPPPPPPRSRKKNAPSITHGMALNWAFK